MRQVRYCKRNHSSGEATVGVLIVTGIVVGLSLLMNLSPRVVTDPCTVAEDCTNLRCATESCDEFLNICKYEKWTSAGCACIERQEESTPDCSSGTRVCLAPAEDVSHWECIPRCADAECAPLTPGCRFVTKPAPATCQCYEGEEIPDPDYPSEKQGCFLTSSTSSEWKLIPRCSIVSCSSGDPITCAAVPRSPNCACIEGTEEASTECPSGRRRCAVTGDASSIWECVPPGVPPCQECVEGAKRCLNRLPQRCVNCAWVTGAKCTGGLVCRNGDCDPPPNCPDQSWCEGLNRCVPVCDPNKCQVLSQDGTCADLCAGTGYVCAGNLRCCKPGKCQDFMVMDWCN